MLLLLLLLLIPCNNVPATARRVSLCRVSFLPVWVERNFAPPRTDAPPTRLTLMRCCCYFTKFLLMLRPPHSYLFDTQTLVLAHLRFVVVVPCQGLPLSNTPLKKRMWNWLQYPREGGRDDKQRVDCILRWTTLIFLFLWSFPSTAAESSSCFVDVRASERACVRACVS